MQKLFRTLFILHCLYSSAAVMASDDLCVAPPPRPSINGTRPEPSADQYHEAMEAAVLQATQSQDWVTNPDADGNCGGYYQAPENPNPQFNLKPGDADLRMSADKVEKDENGYTTLNGDVELYQGSRQLRCDIMKYSEEKEYSEVSGTIQLREPGLLVLSEQATFDNINRTSTFKQTSYVLHEQQARGQAKKINIDAKDGSGYLRMENASFTVCPPTDELWSFNAHRIDIDQDKGWGKLYSAFFEIENVPVFYIPYLDFPIDDRRKTGFLWPSISTSDNGGLDYTQPYYVNLAPQADLTYIPHYISGHGLLNGIETRYKQRFAEWSLGGSYLGNDERVGDVLTKNDITLDDNRWMGFVKEEGRFNANWSTVVDYQTVSDINYFRDWGTNGFDIKKSLNIRRFAQINFSNENWKASGVLTDYQSLEFDPLTGKVMEEDYRNLPSLNLYYRNPLKNFSVNPLLFSQYTFFDHEQKIRAHRLYMEPGLTFPLRWQAGQIMPEIKIKHIEFNLNQSNDSSEALQTGSVYQGSHSVDVPSINIDNRLFFERDLNLGATDLTQTLTPRLFYYYADYKDQSDLPAFDTTETAFTYQQLFRDNRFGSYDRIGDANQVSLAVESSLLNQDDGRKIVSLGIGQIHYLQDRLVSVYNSDTQALAFLPGDTPDIIEEKNRINEEIDRRYYRKSSDIAAEPNWFIDEDQRISGSVVWDPYLSQSQEVALGYHYRDQDQRIFNVAYRNKRNPYYNTDGTWFTLDEVDQTDLSFYMPMVKNWHAYMRWNYDVTNNKTVEDITGVKYEGCCFGVMLAYQRERKTFENNIRIADSATPDYSYSWFIQFELKGLGGITSTISHILEESIQGYKESESNL